MSSIIAVWGPPGGGKTTLASGIASWFSNRGMDTAVVYTDDVVPTLPTIVPGLTKRNPLPHEVKSIGKVVSAVQFSSGDVYKQSVCPPAYQHMILLGYAHGENRESYIMPAVSDIKRFYSFLADMAQYVVVECAPDVQNNPLARVALEVADVVLQTAGADYKSMAFYASQWPLLQGGKVAVKDYVSVFSQAKKSDPISEIASFYTQRQFVLPYKDSIASAMELGDIFAKPFPSDYRRNMQNLLESLTVERDDI